MAREFGAEHGVVLPVRVDPWGRRGPTRREAGGPFWRRSSRGLYVPADVESTPVQRVAEVAAVLDPWSTPTGWAALCWLGGWWFGGTSWDGASPLPVPVASSGHRLRQQAGFQVCEERWSPVDVVEDDGLRLTSAVRSVCFEMRYAPTLDQAVAALDLAAFHDLVSVAEASSWVATHGTYTGIGQARRALLLADENVWSPQESRLQVMVRRHGFGPVRANHPVFDLEGRLIGTPDLLDPANGVAIEYEGAVHLAGSRRAADVVREARMREHGLTPVTMVAADWSRSAAFLERLRTAYAEAERRAADRRFTVELPSWWVPTFTVAQRRSLSTDQRRRWLRWRRPQVA